MIMTWKSDTIFFCLGKGLVCFRNSRAICPNRGAPARLQTSRDHDVNEDDDVDENDGDVEDVDVSNLVCMSSSPSAPPAIASAAIITFEES